MSTDSQIDATVRLSEDGTDREAVPDMTAAPIESSSRTTPDKDWRRDYARRLWITDLIALVWVVFGTQIAWFGLGNAQLAMRENSAITDVSYWAFSSVLIILWMGALSWNDSRSYRIIGAGNSEYVRVASGSIRLFGVIAIIAFLLKIDVARGFLLIGLPVGVLVLLLVRWLWRQWLIEMRARGRYSARVLLVGSNASVAQIARELERSKHAGYLVVGACTPHGGSRATVPGTGIPVLGGIDDVMGALHETGADTVAITSTDDLPPDKVKQISWNLQAGQQHLVLAPSIVDVAGPRLHTRPVAGLPLIHVETPRFSRGQLFVKRMVDLLLSVVGVIVLSPLLAFLALTVRLSSPGPVLFRQTRVGRGGHEFTMLKFRSMVVNAEEMLEQLRRQRREAGIDAGNEVLFKMKNDPRVTRIGRVMRKFSLDELPQLFNVIGGSMSLVGPRPPLPSEVEQYASHVHRRFLVKPGITGLWQVSGRSTLSWEESVRLDLSYVENWTLLGDVAILAKTARAAVLPGETAH